MDFDFCRSLCSCECLDIERKDVVGLGCMAKVLCMYIVSGKGGSKRVDGVDSIV